MEYKLKKTIETSVQGITIVIILGVIANIIGVIISENILKYLADYWASYVYIAGLAIGLRMYKKGEYALGAEIVQWVGLGSIIVTFMNAIMLYIVLGNLGLKLLVILTAIILSILLIFEALKVIRLTGEYKDSRFLIVISIFLMVIILAINIVNVRNLKIEIEKERINQIQKNPNELNEIPVSNPYAEYKDFTWGETTIKTPTENLLKIEDKKLYYLDDTDNVSEMSIVGTPIKLANCNGVIYILTEEGQVYYLDDKNSKFKFADVARYNVIDLTCINNNTNESIYFLTKEGKLIDRNGVDYNKYNFVNMRTLNISNYMIDISFDEDGYVYYYDVELNSYNIMQDASNSKEITAKKIFEFDDKVLITTNDDELYLYEGKNNKAAYVSKNITNITKQINNLEVNLVIAFADKEIKIYNKLIKGYNVEDKIEILESDLSEYRPYDHYKDVIWSGNTTNNAKIKNNKLYLNGKEIDINIPGTLMRLEEVTIANSILIYVLTEEGEVWYIAFDSVNQNNIYAKTQVLTNYKLLDMTIKKSQPNAGTIYCLTADGILLDERENQYLIELQEQ